MLSFPVFVSQNSLAFPYPSFLRPFSASSSRPRLRTGGSSARYICLGGGRASARRPFPRPRNAASPEPSFSSFSFLPSRSVPKVFRIRTSSKRARNFFRIRTSKTRYLKFFRICSYEKTGGGGPLFQAEMDQRGLSGYALCLRVCP